MEFSHALPELEFRGGKEAPVQLRLHPQQSLQLLESMAPPAAFIRPVWLLGSRTLQRLGLSSVMCQVAASFLLPCFFLSLKELDRFVTRLNSYRVTFLGRLAKLPIGEEGDCCPNADQDGYLVERCGWGEAPIFLK